MTKNKRIQLEKEKMIADSSDLIRRIADLFSEWKKDTGGKGMKVAEWLDNPNASEAAKFGQFDAFFCWVQLTYTLIEWTMSADFSYEDGLIPEEEFFPGGTSSSDDRLILFRMLNMVTSASSDKPYVPVVLPTDLAMRVADGLIKLEYGEVEPIFSPGSRKSYKDGYTIPRLQARLLECCYYLYGSGLSMVKARERIANAAGIRAESIRNWEASFIRKYKNAAIRLDWMKWIGAYKTGQDLDTVAARFKSAMTQKALRVKWKQCGGADDRVCSDIKSIDELGHEYRAAVKDQAARVAARKTLRRGKNHS